MVLYKEEITCYSYVFVEPPDGEWGAPKGDNSGNWTGIVQMVLSKVSSQLSACMLACQLFYAVTSDFLFCQLVEKLF